MKQAEGTAQADTLLGGKYAEAKKTTAELAKAWEASKVPGQPAEVTLPTLSITIDKGGETIAAQSVTASKSNVKDPKDLTKAGEKTTVTATTERTAVSDTTKAAEAVKKATTDDLTVAKKAWTGLSQWVVKDAAEKEKVVAWVKAMAEGKGVTETGKEWVELAKKLVVDAWKKSKKTS